jgi:hypothetical protein
MIAWKWGRRERRAAPLCRQRYQERLVRFIENHDEPRAAAFSPAKDLAAAVTVATLREQNSFMKGSLKDEG